MLYLYRMLFVNYVIYSFDEGSHGISDNGSSNDGGSNNGGSSNSDKNEGYNEAKSGRAMKGAMSGPTRKAMGATRQGITKSAMGGND